MMIYNNYHMPMKCCTARLVKVIPSQQQAPMKSGLPPVLISFTISVLRPMAAIAMTIKNLLKSFKGENTDESTPAAVAIVVISDAAIKYNIKKGKIFFKLTFLFSSLLFFLVVINAKTKVIGIMARVLVSLTVTALSSVALPKFHMLSHVEAAAVTEDVSLTAVPAKIPKASPEVVSNPMKLPIVGNITAARTLKKKITEIACATSSSSAFITGAVAAMADPPHMEDPTPTNVDMLEGIFIHLCNRKAIMRETAIVQIIIGNDCLPVSRTTFKSSRNLKE